MPAAHADRRDAGAIHGFGAYKEIFTAVNRTRARKKRKGAEINVLARVKRGVTLTAASAEFDVLVSGWRYASRR